MVKMPVGRPQVLCLRGLDAASSFMFVVKIPNGVPQVLWLLRSRPRWDISSFEASQSRSRLGYLKFRRFVVKTPVGIPQVRIPAGIFQASWSAQVLKLRGQDPGWDT